MNDLGPDPLARSGANRLRLRQSNCIFSGECHGMPVDLFKFLIEDPALNSVCNRSQQLLYMGRCWHAGELDASDPTGSAAVVLARLRAIGAAE